MLNEMAFKRRMTRSDGDMWVKSVQAKLEDVGVETVRDFIHDMLVLNRRLQVSGHWQLHDSTLNMILVEVCVMAVFGPEDEEDEE
jgi:hypothetical protein